MTYLIRTLAFSVLILTLGSPPAAAQEQPDPIETSQSVATQADSEAMAAPAPAAAIQGLPRRAPEPRTLHEFWMVFAALAAAWGGITFYILRFGAPLGRIADTMRRVEGRSKP